MSEPASISTGIAARYAMAIFDLAQESNALDQLESDVGALDEALAASAEFRGMIGSPIYSREDQARATGALAKAMKLSASTSNALALMAGRRRLFLLPQLIARLRDLISEARGEVAANVTSAKPLTREQADRLTRVLKDKIGKDIRLNAAVDESLIGGLVVKVGSKMIDTSIRSRLAALQNAMKEVG